MPRSPPATAILIALLVFALMPAVLAVAPSFVMKGDGRDGDLIVNTTDTVINKYTTLTNNVTAGATTFNLTNCTNFPNGTDILLMDMRGTYQGRWEQHARPNINASCAVTLSSGDSVGWNTSSVVQVVTIPNYRDVRINGSGTIVPAVVDRNTGTGGVIVFRSSGTLNTTGAISTISKGFSGGASGGVSACSNLAVQGDTYDAYGAVSDSANGVAGGGGENQGLCSANAEGGGGGAGQNTSGEPGNRYVTTTETSDQGGAGGVSITSKNVSQYLQIGGGGGGGFDWHASCTATSGVAGSGVAIIYADNAINLNLTLEGANAGNPGNCNNVGAGGGGGAGSAYLNIRVINWTLGEARGGGSSPLKNPGGNGIIGVTADNVTGTTNPTYNLYGAYIPGLTPISWATNITSLSQYWNSTFYLDLNVTNSTDCALVNFTSNNTHFTINKTTGIVTWAANLSKVGEYSVSFSANDNCTATITQTTAIAINYTTPNISTVLITPSPTGTSQPLVCSITLNNPDKSPFTNTTKWYKNGTLQPLLNNTASVGTGNLTIGDQWICQYNGTDTRTTLGPQNSTTLSLGDSTAPTINNFSISPTTGTASSGQIVHTINCTDTESIGSVTIEVTDTNTGKTNYTAASAGGNLYTYTYTLGPAGNYSSRAFCTDGSQNTEISTTQNFTATPATGGDSGASAGGGGGGAATSNNDNEQCEFSIVRPTNGFVNTLCRTGGRSNTFEFVLRNDENVPMTYTTRFSGVDCQIDESTFTVNGKSQHSSYISACICPTNASLEGSINITAGACSGELPIRLYNGILSRAFLSQDVLLRIVIVFFIIAALVSAIVLAAK